MFRLQIIIVIVASLLVSGCKKDSDEIDHSAKDIISSLGIEMIYLPTSYWVSKYETTQEQFTKIMGFNPSSNPLAGKYPIENMTKDEAEEFCRKLTAFDSIRGVIPQGYSYQLPSFVEWKEYVADASLERSITRAGKYNYSDGHDVSLIKICEVGNGDVNSFGLYDLRGNVCEMSREISTDANFPYQILGACYNTSRKEYLDVNNISYTKERRYDSGFRCVLIKYAVIDIHNNILHNAIISGDLHIFSELMENNLDMINISNLYGEAPIHLAVLCNQYDMAKILLENNANVNARTNKGAFPLHYACSVGNTNLVKLLIDNGAILPDSEYAGMSCMHMGVRTWDVEFIKSLVAFGFKDNKKWNLGYKNQYGEEVVRGTALAVALDYQRFDIAKELLKGEVDINLTDMDGQTVLQKSAILGWVEGVKLLVDKGADVNIKDKRGFSALHYAKVNNNEEVEQLLIAHGALENN